ncbi:immunity protein 7 of polymorphic toxin system [Haloactinospora alba]|uniref:Immunity protein 7 of polymorphic toxin system n=1 Tax=Haloactinospora alba TaxID=405555 RepID=A0A543NLZ5_9ACTN|nr:Imm7 family immunity protein [Haloactinospora alba]TQN32827.1 immunity protein 7 of polymorphic toxin system [Haloactinospora alba]
MFEYHGWAAIRATPHEEPLDHDLLRSNGVENTIRESVDELGTAPGLATCVGSTAFWCCTWQGSRTMPVPDTGEAIALFRRVAHLAPGSYGIMHIHDEAPDGRDNELTTLVMKRGGVTEHPDTFLSP